MPGNTSQSFFDQLVEAIEQAQREAQANQRASQANVERARRERAAKEKAAKEKVAKEKAEKEKTEKEKAKKAKESSAAKMPKPEDGELQLFGEKFDARKMVIYSEIMNPKYKD